MHESHEEYMKRRLREEQGNKIFESPDRGKTIYERNFGNAERTKVKVIETPNYTNEQYKKTKEIYNTTLDILEKSKVEGITSYSAALKIAKNRIEAKKS